MSEGNAFRKVANRSIALFLAHRVGGSGLNENGDKYYWLTINSGEN